MDLLELARTIQADRVRQIETLTRHRRLLRWLAGPPTAAAAAAIRDRPVRAGGPAVRPTTLTQLAGGTPAPR